MKRLLVVSLAVAAFVPIGGSAQACSCAQGNPRESLANSDAAFIGTLISRGESVAQGGVIDSGQEVDWRFRVEEAVKGPLGREVVVRSALSGGSCGLGLNAGNRVGLFLRGRDEAWTSSSCSMVDPSALRRAAQPLPAPDGRAPSLLMIGVNYGDVRSLGLDRNGGVVGYGRGDGETLDLAVCKGSDRVVEVVRGVRKEPWWSMGVAVRDLHTLEVVDERRVSALETGREDQHVYYMDPIAASCRDSMGAELSIISMRQIRPAFRVVRVRDGAATVVFEGQASAATLSESRDVAYLAKPRDGSSLVELDLESGRSRLISELPTRPVSLVLSPDESMLAGVAVDSATDQAETNAAAVFVADLRSGRVSQGPQFQVPRGWWSQAPVWIDDSTFAVFPGKKEVRIYDEALGVKSSWKGWSLASDQAVVVDRNLYGLGMGSTVVSAPALGGTVAQLTRLPGRPRMGPLAAIPPPSASSRRGMLGTAVSLLVIAGGLGFWRFQMTRRGDQP